VKSAATSTATKTSTTKNPFVSTGFQKPVVPTPISLRSTPSAKKTANQTSTVKQTSIPNAIESEKYDAHKPQYALGGYSTDGNNYGMALYADPKGPAVSKEHGLRLGSVEVGVTKVGSDYDNFDWSIGVATAGARAGVEYGGEISSVERGIKTNGDKKSEGQLWGFDYIGFNAGASLITAGGDVKIPLPFSDHNLVLGASGKAFAIGAELEWDKKEHKFKIGAAALMGGSLSVGFE